MHRPVDPAFFDMSVGIPSHRIDSLDTGRLQKDFLESLIMKYHSNKKEDQTKMISGFLSARRRAILTAAEARDIFSLGVSLFSSVNGDSSRRIGSKASVAISRLYGISPKTVRDIWNG